MKTIFVSSFNPFILRNVLLNETLKVLQESGVKVVVFVPDYKADFFRREINVSNVIVEGVKVGLASRRDIVFKYLAGSLTDTTTISVNKVVRLNRDGRWFRFAVSRLITKLFNRSSMFKMLIRRLDYMTMKKNYFSNHFSEYQPRLVFATDVFNDLDVYLLAEAKSQKIRTVGMIRSWDNLTSKGILRIKPDKLMVHNEVLKAEAIEHNDFSGHDIFISGIPQYDRYITGLRINRKSFFDKLSFDPRRKLILFSPFGGRFTDTDWQIMEMLKGFIKNKEIPPAQVLVRFTPNDPVSLGNFIPDENFYIDHPGRGFEAKSVRDQELTEADMDWLADCLYHTDVVVAGGASIGIDAAVFGKPTIVIHFDGFDKRPHWQSVGRFLEYQHPRDIIRTGAMRSVRSTAELRQQLISYLNDPQLDRPSREKMLRDQCWRLDGQSGRRIGRLLNSLLTDQL